MPEIESAARTAEEVARVRVLETLTSGCSDPAFDDRTFRPGEIVHVVRWESVSDDVWFTSWDIDGAYDLPGRKIEVLGRSAAFDPEPGSYTWVNATDDDRHFWTEERRAWMNAPEGDGPRSMAAYEREAAEAYELHLMREARQNEIDAEEP